MTYIKFINKDYLFNFMSIHTYNFADITGATHKELGVDEIVDNALSKDLEGIVVISSGNFSFAIQEEITRRESSLKLFNLVGRKSRSNFSRLRWLQQNRFQR